MLWFPVLHGRLVRLLLLVEILVAVPAVARAEGDNAAVARRAFERGQAAVLAEDFARAAEFFELADQVAPTPEALRSATRSRLRAGHLAVAATQALALQRRYPDDAASLKLAEGVLAEAGVQLVKLEVRCDSPCELTLDGAAVRGGPSTQHDVFTTPGERRLRVSFETGTELEELLRGAAGERMQLEFAAPPVPVAASEDRTAPVKELAADEETAGATQAGPAEASRRPSVAPGTVHAAPGTVHRDYKRIPRSVTLISLGAALALGAAATWSGLEVMQAHEDYEKDETRAAYEEGRRLEKRTNALAFSAVGLGAASVLMAFLTRWRRGSQERESPQVGGWVRPTAAGVWMKEAF